MTKQKKKRNKKYTGAGASAQPTVTRLTAANRHPIHQWWIEKKQIAKPALIAAAVVILVVWLVFELIRAFSLFGS